MEYDIIFYFNYTFLVFHMKVLQNLNVFIINDYN